MLVFLVVLTSGLQYLIQGIKYKQDVVRIEKIVGDAKTAAWGNRNAPLEGQRKVSGTSDGPIVKLKLTRLCLIF